MGCRTGAVALRRFVGRKSRDQSRNAAGIGGFVGLSSVRNGNGHYPCHTYPVRWGIRGPHACLQEVRLYSCRLGVVASLRRKEITWPVKKCRRKRWLRRRVLSAERKWSLSVSHLFCSVGNSRTSRWLARSAVIRRNSGLSAGDNPPFRARRSAVGQRAFRNRALVGGDFLRERPMPV